MSVFQQIELGQEAAGKLTLMRSSYENIFYINLIRSLVPFLNCFFFFRCRTQNTSPSHKEININHALTIYEITQFLAGNKRSMPFL